MLGTIGIRPTHPHPGFGYLCAGAPVAGWRRPRVFRLGRFIEKPTPGRAQQLLRSGRTYWNSGTFVGRAETFLEEVGRWIPEHARRLGPLSRWWGTASFAQRAHQAYRTLRAISFDHGVMNHVRSGLIVEGSFRWADVGNCDAWAKVATTASIALPIDSKRPQVVSDTAHLFAFVDVSQRLLVVHTRDATLICPAGSNAAATHQKIRSIAARLASDRRLARYR